LASSCATNIGQLTGLEPVTVYSEWQPQPFGDRSVSGAFWLRKLPDAIESNYDLALPYLWPPAPFDKDCVQSINSCLESVHQIFPGDSDTIRSWAHYYQNFAPSSNNSVDYIHSKMNLYKLPMKPFIFEKDLRYQCSWIEELSCADITVVKHGDLVALGLACVTWYHDRAPPPPISILSTNDYTNTRVSSFFENNQQLYESMLSKIALPEG